MPPVPIRWEDFFGDPFNVSGEDLRVWEERKSNLWYPHFPHFAVFLVVDITYLIIFLKESFLQ